MPEPQVGGPVIGAPRTTAAKIEEVQARKLQEAAGSDWARWRTVGDENVCPPCNAMNNKRVRVDSVPYVCLGTCRCGLVPEEATAVAPPPVDAWMRYFEQRIIEVGAELHTWLVSLSDEELAELQRRYETLEAWEFDQWWHEEWWKWKERQLYTTLRE